MNHRLLLAAASTLASVGPLASTAHAQAESTLLEPGIPSGFDRDRNVGVADRPRPDYDPVGLLSGPFNIYPRIDIGVGFSDNVYFSNTNKRSDGFVAIAPQIRAESDWSRNYLTLRGSANIERYFTQPRRNQEAWDLGALGRLDLGSTFNVTGEAQLGQSYETPFTGAINSDVAVLSHYLRNFVSVRGRYEAGQARFTLAGDHTGFAFKDIVFASGARLLQGDRDRTVNRVTAQGEFAFSPSAALYLQSSYGTINYSRLLYSGLANRDSRAFRLIGGASFDIAALVRGTVGVGYTRRDFDSTLYSNVSGVSVEARVQYFPTELTTATVELSRLIEDSSIGTNSAFFNNQVSAQIDHEALVNLILSANAQYSRQSYIASVFNADIYRVGLQARYLSSRTLSLKAGASYSHRSTNDTTLGTTSRELRGLVTLTLAR